MSLRTRLHTHTTRQGDRLRIKAFERPQKELFYAWSRACKNRIWLEDLEALSVSGEGWNPHRPSEPQVYFYAEGAQYEATKVAGAYKRL
jgi:hypothetical protein